MIHSDSRMRFTEYLPYDARFPIILPKGHWVTRLIVRYFHALANHSAGINFVLMQISQRYWIPTTRDEIKDCKNQCNECKKTPRKTRPQHKLWPLYRQNCLGLTYRAFDQNGVDYAGPITTIQGRGKLGKNVGYVCFLVFLCKRSISKLLVFGYR